jgi:hypothetical protein
VNSVPGAPGDYRGRRLPRGTRMLRMRSTGRRPQQGQPARPVTDPERIPHQDQEEHFCAECFGPRSRYRDGPFCARCEQDLFGDGRSGYTRFIRSERARRREAAKKAAETGETGDTT